MNKKDVIARLHDAHDGFVECANCGKDMISGSLAVKINDEWFCKACGMQIFWEMESVTISDSDCDDDVQRRIEEEYGEYVDECYDCERDREIDYA